MRISAKSTGGLGLALGVLSLASSLLAAGADTRAAEWQAMSRSDRIMFIAGYRSGIEQALSALYELGPKGEKLINEVADNSFQT